MIWTYAPCARPYSAPAPAVTTEISSIESEATWFRNFPVNGSTLLTPETVALRSRVRAPLTFGLPSPFGSCTPGASARMFV